MEHLSLIGVSHRRGGTAALETLGSAFAQRPVDERLADLGITGFLTLTTCNRVDVLVHRPAGVSTSAVRDALTPYGRAVLPYAYQGEAAFEQLARVAASLDSLNPGEDQIMRQVRDAASTARSNGRVEGVLSFAIDAALRIAKTVRREVPLAPQDASLFSLARSDVETAVRDVSAPRLLLLGGGTMAELVARSLPPIDALHVTIANRTLERAQQVARTAHAKGFDVDVQTLDTVRATPPDAHVLVTALGGNARIDTAWIAAIPSLRLIVDLGVPRNVQGHADVRRSILIRNVDTLETAGATRREALQEALAQAERVLRRELDVELDAWNERTLGPSIQAFKRWLIDALSDELPGDEARRIAHRLAHVPVKGLRAVARDHGVAAARTFLAETGLDHTTEGDAR